MAGGRDIYVSGGAKVYEESLSYVDKMYITEIALAWDYAGEKNGIGKAGYMLRKTQGMGFTAARELWVDEFGNSYDEERMRRYTREFLQKYYASNRVPAKESL